MALSRVRQIFGIHEVTPYKTATRLPYGTLKVLGGATFTLSGELIKLEGGSYNYAWAVEDGRQTAELTFTAREYPPFMYELFLGKAPTEASASSSGSVTTITNVSGSSVAANTGIGSVSVTSGSDSELKFTKYVIKATDSDTVTMYAYSDQDFTRGTDKSFESDDLEILSADLTITQSAATAVSGFGLDLNGGSGNTIAMTSGETASIEVLPPTTRNHTVKIGNPVDRTPEFGCYLVAETASNGRMYAIDCFRCRAIGMPISLNEKAFSEAEIKAEVFYDSSEEGICSIRDITPESAS